MESIEERVKRLEEKQKYLEYLILGLHSFMQSSQQLIEGWIEIKDGQEKRQDARDTKKKTKEPAEAEGKEAKKTGRG